MNEAEIKLHLIRIIDKQKGKTLTELYELVLSKFLKKEQTVLTPIENGYKEMSQDIIRENEAFDWIENTLNSEDL